MMVRARLRARGLDLRLDNSVRPPEDAVCETPRARWTSEVASTSAVHAGVQTEVPQAVVVHPEDRCGPPAGRRASRSPRAGRVAPPHGRTSLGRYVELGGPGLRRGVVSARPAGPRSPRV